MLHRIPGCYVAIDVAHAHPDCCTPHVEPSAPSRYYSVVRDRSRGDVQHGTSSNEDASPIPIHFNSVARDRARGDVDQGAPSKEDTPRRTVTTGRSVARDRGGSDGRAAAADVHSGSAIPRPPCQGSNVALDLAMCYRTCCPIADMEASPLFGPAIGDHQALEDHGSARGAHHTPCALPIEGRRPLDLRTDRDRLPAGVKHIVAASGVDAACKDQLVTRGRGGQRSLESAPAWKDRSWDKRPRRWWWRGRRW